MSVRELLFALCLLPAACSPGPGRPVVFPDATVMKDAEVKPDAEPEDAGVVDFGQPDIGVFDSGVPPSFPFVGVFSILNSNDLLFAREINGQLQLTVADFPYVYEGTISATGMVDVRSLTLENGGCPDARIWGQYERAGATHVLTHRTCGANGSFLESEIRGAFISDFSTDVSGVYRVQTSLLDDTFGCAPAVPAVSEWVVSALGDGATTIFMADDVSPPHSYFGRLMNQRMVFNGSYKSASDISARDVAMIGTFVQANANDPLTFSGTRDTYDSGTDCVFRISFDGTRVAAP